MCFATDVTVADAVCILLTPILLDEITQFPQFGAEELTALVVGLPMAANIGATYTLRLH